MEVTLSEMLSCREARAEMQETMLKKHSLPVISFTMNIAGPIKTSPIIERSFNEGLLLLFGSISEEKIAEKTVRFLKTGPEAFLSVDLSPESLKDICTRIEEKNALGRLFDMDVISPDGQKLTRKNERDCLVCGKEGRGCAASRAHSAEEVFKASEKIMREHFEECYSEKIALLAKKSLVDEVETTPKAGLVDKNNCGSHKDMNVDTFLKSAEALKPYFKECVRVGFKTAAQPPHNTFLLLRQAGIEAENKMLKVTGGVNTHKGAIYSMGLVCGAIGRLYNAHKPIANTEDILIETAKLVEKSAAEDLKNAAGKTAGEWLYLEHKIMGIRGQALSGFLDVRNIALPSFEAAIKGGKNKNDAAVICLVSLIANVEDTNLYKRGGKDGAEFARAYAQNLLKEGITHQKLFEMDREFINRNLSPGGCADLLALTLFLHSLK